MPKKTEPRLSGTVTHLAFSEIAGVSRVQITTLVGKGILRPHGTLGEWLTDYITHLRRSRTPPDLAVERAGLAREQKLLTRIKKQKELGEWAPISALTKVLASITSQMASTFDSIPVQLKRKWPELSGEQLNIVRAELSQARNLMVATGVEAVRAIALAETEYADEFADAADDDDEPE